MPHYAPVMTIPGDVIQVVYFINSRVFSHTLLHLKMKTAFFESRSSRLVILL